MKMKVVCDEKRNKRSEWSPRGTWKQTSLNTYKPKVTSALSLFVFIPPPSRNIMRWRSLVTLLTPCKATQKLVGQVLWKALISLRSSCPNCVGAIRRALNVYLYFYHYLSTLVCFCHNFLYLKLYCSFISLKVCATDL